MTATYEVIWKPSAIKDLRRLPKTTVRRIVGAVQLLTDEPLPPGARQLTGTEHSYRLRVGDYRVIYEFHGSRLLIEIVRARHRKDAYRDR